MQEFTEQELKNETWKNVPGYEGYYEISTLGRIRSIARNGYTKSGHKHYFKGVMLKLSSKPNGMSYIYLLKNKLRTRFCMTKLMLMAFNNDHSTEIFYFLDKNITNNRLVNIIPVVEGFKICTHKYHIINSDNFYEKATMCKDCTKEKSAIWQKENIEHRRIYLREYAQLNREHLYVQRQAFWKEIVINKENTSESI